MNRMAMGCGRTTSGQAAPLAVVLYQPRIPQNTGNVARTCAATRVALHLVEPLGFFLSDRYLKRAGLDYWPHVDVTVHRNLEALRRQLGDGREVYFSSHADRCYYEFDFEPGDLLFFGAETKGLPEPLLATAPERTLCLPIDRSRVRSLNLATTAGVVLFEALRQLDIRS